MAQAKAAARVPRAVPAAELPEAVHLERVVQGVYTAADVRQGLCPFQREPNTGQAIVQTSEKPRRFQLPPATVATQPH